MKEKLSGTGPFWNTWIFVPLRLFLGVTFLSATTFTLASNGDPAILIHLNSGTFVAFDATCTHAGCPVDYDTTSQQLVCPCHGASFDPARAAAVIDGPAQTPLISLPIKVDQSTGAISLSS